MQNECDIVGMGMSSQTALKCMDTAQNLLHILNSTIIAAEGQQKTIDQHEWEISTQDEYDENEEEVSSYQHAQSTSRTRKLDIPAVQSALQQIHNTYLSMIASLPRCMCRLHSVPRNTF